MDEAPTPIELEARFVDHFRAQHGGFRDLRRVAGALGVSSARDQVEAAYAGVLDVGAREVVARGQRVVGGELIIHPRREDYAALRNAQHAGERIDDGERLRVDRDAVDDGAVVDGMALDVEGERRALVDGAAQHAAVLLQQKGRLALRVGVARVPEIVAEVEEAGAR